MTPGDLCSAFLIAVIAAATCTNAELPFENIAAS